MMTAKQLAEMLDGREYLSEITREEEQEAAASNLVVVTGYSDDCVDLYGAIDDEIGAFNGVIILLNKHGAVHKTKSVAAPNAIKVIWYPSDREAMWYFETEIPHETFTIWEDGKMFSEGIVFSLNDLV